MRASTVALALAAAMTALAPAAAAQNSKKVPDAPLDFDPARPERVDGWWTNGSELLRLEPNGAYRLWPTEDRFMRPAEVGAWRRDNYVFFDLEPYGAKPGTRFRVMMRKQEGRTELQRDGLAAFRQIASPPRVFGDEMLGAWGSPAEELLILDTGRYEWRRVGKAPGISAHSGQWMTDGESLTIAPDIDSVASPSKPTLAPNAQAYTAIESVLTVTAVAMATAVPPQCLAVSFTWPGRLASSSRSAAMMGQPRGSASGVAYASSKHAVHGLTRNMSVMYSGNKIRTNAVAPGGVATNIEAPFRSAHAREVVGGIMKHVVPGWATADEVAAMICWVLSDEASNVNGAILSCDGGWSAI